MLETLEQERPAAIQIVASGRNEEYLKTCIEFLESYNFDVLDINAGCPAHHTMKSGGGGNLIRDLSDGRLQTLFNICTKFSSKPVSVKTRIGHDMNKATILEVAKMAQNAGLAYITLHGRTVDQMYAGTVNLEMIREVKASTTLPIIGNGDVVDYKSYKAMKATQCDAIMIGRGAMFEPRIFSHISACKSAEEAGKTELPQLPHLTLDDVRNYILKDEEFINSLSNFWNNERFRLAEMRRLAIWWIRGIPGFRKARESLSRASSFAKMKEFIFSSKIESVMLEAQKEEAKKPVNPPEKIEEDFGLDKEL
jgi:tRNA-dihydrouridine synthase B